MQFVTRPRRPDADVACTIYHKPIGCTHRAAVSDAERISLCIYPHRKLICPRSNIKQELWITSSNICRNVSRSTTCSLKLRNICPTCPTQYMEKRVGPRRPDADVASLIHYHLSRSSLDIQSIVSS